MNENRLRLAPPERKALVGRRELLSSAQRAQLLSWPSSLGELEKFYTLTPADRLLYRRHVAAGIVVILYWVAMPLLLNVAL
jgi:hypothetical protein